MRVVERTQKAKCILVTFGNKEQKLQKRDSLEWWCVIRKYITETFFIKRQIREGLHLESFNTFTQRQRSNPIWCQVIREA